MKKFLLILLVLIISVGVVYYLYRPEAVRPVARLVPRDACLFFSVVKGEAAWKKVEGSGWWRSVSEVEALSKMRDTVASVAGRQSLELGLDLKQGHLLELLGEEVGIAVVPGVRSGGTLLVLARSSGSLPGDIMDNLENSGIYRCDDGSYRGARMLLLRTTGGKGPVRGVCHIRDILAFAVSDEDPLAVLRQVVDLVRGSGKDSLAESDIYRQVVSVRGEAQESNAVAYFDFSGLEEGDELLPGCLDIPGDLSGQVDLAKRSIIVSLKQMKAGGGVVHLEGGLRATLYYIPDPGSMDEASRELLRVKPKKLKSLKLIPAPQMLYSASLLGAAGDLWESFIASIEQTSPAMAPGVRGAVGEWETATGLSLERDLLPVIGDEVAYCVRPPGGGQLLPLMPELGLILRLKDVRGARIVVDKMAASMAAGEGVPGEESAATPGESGTGAGVEEARPPETEMYKGHTITFMPTGFIGLYPVYTLLGDFFVVASDIGLMRAMIDVWLGEKESVNASSLYGSLCHEFGETASSVTFVDMGLSLDYLKSLSRVFSSLMNIASGEDGQRTDFTPFLDSLGVVKYFYTKTDTSEEVVKQVIFVKIEDI